MLPSHVDFTIMIIMEWDNLNKCRSETRKAYIKRLKPGMGLPHRVTCIKIMKVIKMLMSNKPYRVTFWESRALNNIQEKQIHI